MLYRYPKLLEIKDSPIIDGTTTGLVELFRTGKYDFIPIGVIFQFLESNGTINVDYFRFSVGFTSPNFNELNAGSVQSSYTTLGTRSTFYPAGFTAAFLGIKIPSNTSVIFNIQQVEGSATISNFKYNIIGYNDF